MQEKVVYRSRIAYVHLAAVVVVSALVALLLTPGIGVAVAVVGLVWVLLTLRSGIEVTDDGFRVRGLLRTRMLAWEQTDAFVVVSYGGTSVPDYAYAQGLVRSAEALSSQAVAYGSHMFSLVAVVTDHGERIKVLGTSSSFLDAAFPAQAAIELNRILKQRNPAATAS